MTDHMKNLSVNQLVALIKDQAANIPEVGEMLFGEALTEEHVIHALGELSRVATLYAAEISSRNV